MVEGVRKWIAVVSFNRNEAHAVDLLLTDLVPGAPSPWARHGERAVRRAYGSDEWHLEHVPLLAQGNLLAGVQLAEFFRDRRRQPDYVVFYGCAGALNPSDNESVFLVRHANYLSLGTVARAARNQELVTLKNKWLCHLMPDGDVEPLEGVSFPLVMPNSALDLCRSTSIPPAVVAATDKVIRVGPGVAPTPVQRGLPHDRYAKAEWTYGQALALVAAGAVEPVIVEMESYGIGRMVSALNLGERVVVLRVTTDSLENQADSDGRQQALLERGRATLGRVLLALFAPTAETP